MLVTTHIVLVGFHDHEAFCTSFSQRLSAFSPQLGRELIVGDWEVGESIFSDFKKSILGHGNSDGLKLEKNLQVSKPACVFNLTSTYVEYPVFFADRQVALVRGKIEHLDSVKFLAVFVSLALLLFSTFRLWAGNLFSSLQKELVNPLRGISKGEALPPEKIPSEVREIDENFKQLRASLEATQKEALRLEKNKELGSLAFQVAHDLRSPLWVLTTADQITDDRERENIKGSALGQIIGITDRLLESYRQDKAPKSGLPVFVGSILRSAINEKRLQHRLTANDLRLEFDISELEALACVDRLDLMRVVSNILQNSVEAMDKSAMKIEVRLKKSDKSNFLNLIISDNGRGIPSHVISKLFEEGFTFGKINGTGLGLYGARNYVESVGGTIGIESKFGEGAQVLISLPQAPQPSWLATKVEIPKGAKVIIIDDDPSIRAQWKSRLHDFEVEVFEKYDENIFSHLAATEGLFFIVDYQIGHRGPTGTDIIMKHKLSSRALLSTSYFDEANVVQVASEHRLKILPKSVIATVPIIAYEKAVPPVDGFALIDDSHLIRGTWTLVAKQAGITFSAFENKNAFLNADLPKAMPVYVDLKLANGEDGMAVADELHSLGYKEIHLATGREGFMDRATPAFIKSVRDKAFPYEVETGTTKFPPREAPSATQVSSVL